MKLLLRKVIRRYRMPMGIARRPQERIRALPALGELDQWVNHWVAVKDGHVIAVAVKSSELGYKLHQMGPAAQGAVMQYVRPSPDGFIVGVG